MFSLSCSVGSCSVWHMEGCSRWYDIPACPHSVRVHDACGSRLARPSTLVPQLSKQSHTMHVLSAAKVHVLDTFICSVPFRLMVELGLAKQFRAISSAPLQHASQFDLCAVHSHAELRAHLQRTAQRFLHSLVQLGLLPLELLLYLVPAGRADHFCDATGAAAKPGQARHLSSS